MLNCLSDTAKYYSSRMRKISDIILSSIEESRGDVVAGGERFQNYLSLVFHRSGLGSLLPQKRQWNVGELSLHGNPVVAANGSLGGEGGGKKVIDGE